MTAFGRWKQQPLGDGNGKIKSSRLPLATEFQANLAKQNKAKRNTDLWSELKSEPCYTNVVRFLIVVAFY